MVIVHTFTRRRPKFPPSCPRSGLRAVYCFQMESRSVAMPADDHLLAPSRNPAFSLRNLFRMHSTRRLRGRLFRGFKETRNKAWIKPRKLKRMKIRQSRATRIFTYLSSFYSFVIKKKKKHNGRNCTSARIKNVLCDMSKEKHSSILFLRCCVRYCQRDYISSPRRERYAKHQRAARKAITKQFDTLNLPLHSPLTQLPSALMPITIVLECRTSLRFSYLPRKLQLRK